MYYNSFPGRIIVEKTSEQYFQLLPPTENQKSLFNRRYTWVQGWMMDKWMMEMDQRGLYKGEKTSIRGGSENNKKGDYRRFTVALERTYHLK